MVGRSTRLSSDVKEDDLRRAGQERTKEGPNSVAESRKYSQLLCRKSEVSQAKDSFMDQDPNALKMNQSQEKFWYKVRVKSSTRRPKPNVIEMFRMPVEAEKPKAPTKAIPGIAGKGIPEISKLNRENSARTQQPSSNALRY